MRLNSDEAFVIATCASNLSGNTVQLLLPGETASSGKYYKVLNTDGISNGVRVPCAKISGTIVVLGAFGAGGGGSAGMAQEIPYGECDNTSTATAFTATVPGITELKNGTIMLLKNGVVTSAAGFTIDINNLGAKPVYNNMAAASPETTLFNTAYTFLFIYDEDRVAGGCWILYRGYDSNTNTIGYQLRTNSSSLPLSDKTYRYRILFTSADGKKWVPANAGTSTSASTKKTPNTKPIDPFGSIVYMGTTTVYDAGEAPGATILWQQQTFALGYSFNPNNTALTMTFPAPVYVVCTPQTDGSALLEGFTQDLPSTNDGKIFIFLGRAYSATNIEMTVNHPVYYHNGTGIRLWTGG